jgi:RimJ/RimL family protein N-acetyltransferase
MIDATEALFPRPVMLRGTYVHVAPIIPEQHTEDLFPHVGTRENAALWTYLFDGPFEDRDVFHAYLTRRSSSTDPVYFAIVDAANERAVGLSTLMRIEPRHRVIEVGGILFSPALQRSRGATEAMYLLARHVFEDLGYRRYEWKCNALNEPSRRAALRLGFTFEGIFRQHMIIKGHSRDTAWYAMLDVEWPSRKGEFERWLSPDNFDDGGRQRTTLTMPSKAD